MNGFKEKFNEYLRGITRGEIKYNGKRVGVSTLNNYISCLKHYEKFNEDLILDEVDLYNYTDRSSRIQARKKSNGHFNRFISYLQKEGIKPSTQKIYLSKIKTVLLWLKEDDMIEINISKVQPPDSFSETLIWDNSMTEVLLDAAPKTDLQVLFQLQIYLCCRFSELQTIDSFETSEIDGETIYTVSVRQDKTNQRVNPIIPKHIWEKAKSVKIPKMYNKDYNRELRNWLKTFPEFHKEISFSKQRPDGKILVFKKEWYKKASSHDLRRAGINRLQVMDVPDDIIRELYSGHRSMEVFNKHYVGINKEKIANVANKIR